ncbi:uncharacterized protein LOC113225622 [Hyposmocoma kahamanoa]|uniref:uncharacterized protein LOC113225622 n=1 Tax=Hyposmocoma kahamanoa TaxID=1477025 RepID=UPI000E6D806D|nr:uncharacterized protein LOC113225622 [Hyposmocoma kahamanoa]
MADEEQTDPLLSVQMAIAIISLFFFATGLVFAVLLFCGVRKQKPEYIKAYFVYGVVVVMLSQLSANVFGGAMSVIGLIISVSAFVVCVLYSLILLMIRKTYRKYETLHSQLEHKDLEEKA